MSEYEYKLHILCQRSHDKNPDTFKKMMREMVDEHESKFSQLLSDAKREERKKFLEILGEDETPNLENLLVTHDSCDSEKCFENQTRNEFRKELKSKLALTTAEESIKKLNKDEN